MIMANNPTAAQKRFWGKVFEVGCIPCHLEGKFSFPEIHHVKKHGRRDHSLVYGCCPAHHRPTAGVTGVMNRHGNPKEFSEKYGTDAELYRKCMELIGEK